MTKKQTKVLDDLWAKLVKVKAAYACEFCGRKNGLNSHHVFSRSNRSVRWDDENGICLCASHHVLGDMSAHKAPMDFSEWMKRYRGDKWYQRLRKKAFGSTNPPNYEKLHQALSEKLSTFDG